MLDPTYANALAQTGDLSLLSPTAPPPPPRPASVKPTEKAQENYYLTAADPTKDAPEERMKQILRAKYQAGLLKPFNYVKGYARLGKFMERHYLPTTRQKIARQLEKFRPKFRERTQKLTDLDLVSVEEWFEKILMEYDRVFASMAIPACLWRRTGEIFRGNKEFAELIKAPIETLRDVSFEIGKLDTFTMANGGFRVNSQFMNWFPKIHFGVIGTSLGLLPSTPTKRLC